MSELVRALAAYQTFDPAGWVGVYQHLPVYAGLLCVALGVVLLLIGGGSTFRVVAGPLGLVVGLLWTQPTLSRLGVAQSTPQLAAVSGLALMLLGVALPPALLFFAAGLPAGLLVGGLAGRADFLLGFVPGFLVGGAMGAVAHRVVGSVLASVVGAWLTVLGLLAVLEPFAGFARGATAHPWAVLGAAALLAAGGSFYQLLVRPTPEEAEKQRRERHRERQRMAEKRELERRWGKAE